MPSTQISVWEIQYPITAKAAYALRPTAPEFVPSHHSAGGSPEAPATGGGAASHLQRPPPFDGR